MRGELANYEFWIGHKLQACASGGGIIVLNCNVMSFEEEVVKSLDSTKELNSFQPMRDMVALARGKNISDKEIKSKLLSLFVKYYEEGENNNEESRDRADKIADLLDEMDYNRV